MGQGGGLTLLYDVRLRSYGASKLPNFRILAYFFPYKTPKTYLPVTSLQPRGYIGEWSRFFHVVVCSRRSKRVPFQHRSFPATFGSGAGDPQTCPNFRLWQMAIPIQNASTRRVRSGPKMSENAQFWGRRCTFSPNIFAPIPKITPNLIFGTFQCKTYYTESSL